MKHLGFVLIMIFLCFGISQAQIDRSNGGVLIKAEEDKKSTESSLSIKPKASLSKTTNGFTVTPNTTLTEDKKKTVDMTPQKSKFIDQRFTYKPSWAKNDRPVEERFKADQYLGDVKTNARYVEVLCRDHEFVDGDRVRIYLNEEVIEPNVLLSGGYYGLIIDLKPGFNKIDFQALNMGTSGPNTAELKIIDDQGNIISSNQWNLTTGHKATIIITK